MTPEEEILFEQFTRAREVDGELAIEVAEIDWPHPCEPVTNWVAITYVSATSSIEEIDAARRALLKRRRYFKRCDECGERRAAGYMWVATVCMSCAEKNHGVVF